MKLTKKEWLNELVCVDEYGRSNNLSDVPMTLMVRKKVFKLNNVSKEEIDKAWKAEKT